MCAMLLSSSRTRCVVTHVTMNCLVGMNGSTCISKRVQASKCPSKSLCVSPGALAPAGHPRPKHQYHHCMCQLIHVRPRHWPAGSPAYRRSWKAPGPALIRCRRCTCELLHARGPLYLISRLLQLQRHRPPTVSVGLLDIHGHGASRRLCRRPASRKGGRLPQHYTSAPASPHIYGGIPPCTAVDMSDAQMQHAIVPSSQSAARMAEGVTEPAVAATGVESGRRCVTHGQTDTYI